MSVNPPITDIEELSEALTWNFSQVFGDSVEDTSEIAEADIISAVKFNHSGQYLATGDRGGRVVLFERNQTDVGNPAEYRFFTEFQSHEAEFDYLKSLEIEEKINQIEWLKQCNSSHFLLTTNDKTVKLWKVSDNYLRDRAVDDEPAPAQGPVIPLLKRSELSQPEAKCKRTFAHAHAYHINSISINSDEETFISTDDLRVNLWNLAVTDQSFNIVDIKPENMEELTEVITCSQFHPSHCNIFAYGSSRGSIKLADMRSSALCDAHAKQFEVEIDPSKKSFFSEIISSISDVKFSHDGRYIMSRDYLTIKIWDLAMEREPVEEYHVHNYLKPRMCDLYENDSIFDKYEVSWSGNDQQIMTGSYNNLFHVFDRSASQDVILHASRDAIEGPTHVLSPMTIGAAEDAPSIPVDSIDFSQKIMHAAWHPYRPIIALAAVNNLYLFRQ